MVQRSSDSDVRAIVLPLLMRVHQSRQGTLVIEEMGLCQGSARIDLAVISSTIHGFEIKSARDTLDRLEAQVMVYSRVLQRVTLVADQVHMPEVTKMVPRWWGLWKVSHERGRIVAKDLRQPRDNPRVDPTALVQLLWRDEVVALLHQRNILAGYRSKPREVLWSRLVENITIKELYLLVAQQLRSRPSWRLA